MKGKRTYRRRLRVVRRLAVRGNIEAFAYLFFRHAQAHHQIRDFVCDEGHEGGPDDGDSDRFRLNPQLARDAFKTWLHFEPVVHEAGATQRRRIEYTG